MGRGPGDVLELDFDFLGYATSTSARCGEPREPRLPALARGCACSLSCQRARCVIIGGGVAGTSIAYHLAELGCATSSCSTGAS